MANAAKWLPRLEVALLLLGVSVLGVTFAAAAQRWGYQQQQAGFLLPVLESNPPSIPANPPSIPAMGVEQSLGGSASSRETGSDAPAGRDPLILGRIAIARVGVDAMIRVGEDDETLAVAVGHLPGTALPGEPGNIVLAAHRDTFFRGLQAIGLGDRIEITVPPHVYEYVVVETRVVGRAELSVLDSNGMEELTLITCHPFDFIGGAPDRFVVRAVPTAVREAAASASGGSR